MTGSEIRCRFQVAESDTAEAREARHRTAGCSSGGSYAGTLRAMAPGAACDIVRPHGSGEGRELQQPLESYDAVFLTGSPLHIYEDSVASRRQLSFMRAVFAAGTPSFESCAGLQVAVAAAGGRVGKAPRHEGAFARRITATELGVAHPMLAGRPKVWDALAIHSDAVEALPQGAVLLPRNALCPVQAAAIRFDGGVFWGVRYHPQLTITEMATAMRRQVDDLVADSLVASAVEAEQQIGLIDALGAALARRDLAWQLELRNFIDAVVHRRLNASAMARS